MRDPHQPPLFKYLTLLTLPHQQTGYVPAWSAVVFGILGAAFANYATKLKFILRIDDALDIFAVHGIGGLVGNVLTAFFAADYIAHLDGATTIKGGWVNQHWIQLAYQLADSFSGGAYSFVGTSLILFIMNLIPGLHLRASEESEILGIDDAEIGEFAYDYVELTREVLNDVDGAETNSMFSSEQHHLHPHAAAVGVAVTTNISAGGRDREFQTPLGSMNSHHTNREKNGSGAISPMMMDHRMYGGGGGGGGGVHSGAGHHQQ